MYSIRTKDGQRTAEVDNRTAGRMIGEVSGRWVQKNFIVGGKTVVYEFSESTFFGNPTVRLWISAGFYLKEEQ